MEKFLNNIFNRKADGNTAIVVLSLFTFIIVSLFGIFIMFHKVMMNGAEGVQDDVMLSNLAVYKNIDRNILAVDSNDLEITDINSALQTFKYYLSKNMKLDSNLKPMIGSVVANQVIVNEFTIYNVKGSIVKISTYNNGTFTEREVADKITNPVITSNGIIVKNTSIHATISYSVNLLFGQTKEVTTSVDTDIVK